MIRKIIFGFILLCGTVVAKAGSKDFDQGIWDSLLKAHVVILDAGQVTQVDYAGMAQNIRSLDQYLSQVSAVKQVDFDHWSQTDQLSFLINAYNAWTVKFVLTGYPDIVSIKDLGNWIQSPWQKPFIPLFGETRTLNDIEHGLIRGSGRYHDPRVHFALNCASIGCPALRPEAYQGSRLDSQLENQTKLFLGDKTRNRLEGGDLKVSSIFKWYHEDFDFGWMGIHGLPDFFVHYAAALNLSVDQSLRIKRGEIPITYLDYDWRLNAKGR
ncbi:DUF547 domain-containing protein [Ferrovum sp.]|uniref:DUF547 domain-containing protein n=1 Tax=Ferrovum sp. TaxID=2609467 RepID=UPI002625D57A|nr:DUF547 domain-containing protein [Ferrovum sp.]